MDMKKYSSAHFIKVTDVRDGPIEAQIAAVREGKYDKPDLVFENGDMLSLNATNNKILMRAYGADSDYWLGKTIKMFLGEVEYQRKMQEAVLVQPISPSLKDTKAANANRATDQDPSDEIPF
jgi:hypothetical protein